MGGKTCLFPFPWSKLRLLSVVDEFLFLLLISLPMGIVALAHGLALRYDLFPQTKIPLDFGLSFRGKRLFGENKTLRGALFHLVFSLLGAYISGLLQGPLFRSTLPFLDLSENFLQVGILLGLGMTIGELPNSFIKRQLSIRPGMRPKGGTGILFFFLDQVDMVFGIWIFLPWVAQVSFRTFFLHLLIFLIFHPLITYIGFLLRMRRTKT